MAKSRIFIYNPSGSNIKGTNQYNFLAVANNFEPISQSVLMDPNFECWEGPDESLGYVIAYVEMSGNRPNAPERILGGNVPCHIGFKRTKTFFKLKQTTSLKHGGYNFFFVSYFIVVLFTTSIDKTVYVWIYFEFCSIVQG